MSQSPSAASRLAEAAEDYAASLGELTENRKPMINMLTMLAEEEQQNAQAIVKVIENHIAKAAPDRKLPAMYLIDSIVKNCHDTPYKELFQRNIVKTFHKVFEQADERTRGALYKLRHTWTGIFSGARLYAIDIRVNSVDPNWPIVSPARAENATIHVNPNFIAKKDAEDKAAELKLLEERKRKLEVLEHEKAKLMQQKERNGAKLASVVCVPGDRDPRDPRKRPPNSTQHPDKDKHRKSNKRSHEGSRESSIERGKKSSRRSKSPNKSDRQKSRDKDRSAKDKGKALPLKKRPVGTDVTETISSGSDVDARVKTEPMDISDDDEAKRAEEMRKLLAQSPPRVDGDVLERDSGREKMGRIPKIKKEHTHHTHNDIPHYEPRHSRSVHPVPTPTAMPGNHAFQSGVLAPPPHQMPGPSSQPQQMAPVQSQPMMQQVDSHMFNRPMLPGMSQSRSMGLLPAPGPGYGRFGPPGLRPPLMPQPPQFQPAPERPDPAAMIPANNRIYVDGRAYEVQYIDDIAVIERNGLPHKIYFSGPKRDVVIDNVAYSLAFGEERHVSIDGQTHKIKFGAPSKELFMGQHSFRGAFGGPAIMIMINGIRHEIRLGGPPPEVKIDHDPCYELLRKMPHAHPSMPRGFAHDFGSSAAPPPPTTDAQMNIAQIGLPPQEPCAPPSVDIFTLLGNLQKSGVLTQVQNQQNINKSPARPATPPIPSQYSLADDQLVERQKQPPITLKEFSMRSLKIRYTSVIDSLYSTMKKSCPHCGLRFDDTQSGKYARHLDWHFQDQNRSQEARAISRPWYFVIDDWIEYAEGDEISKSKSAIFEAQAQSPPNFVEPVVEASSGVQACAVCGEDFESFFDEDEDVWKLKNAIISDERVCHPLCAQDISANPVPDAENPFFPPLDVALGGLPGLGRSSTAGAGNEQLVLVQHRVKTEVDEAETQQSISDSNIPSPFSSDTHASFVRNEPLNVMGDEFAMRQVKSEPNFDVLTGQDGGSRVAGPPDVSRFTAGDESAGLPDPIVQAMVRDADYSDDEEGQEDGEGTTLMRDCPFPTARARAPSPGTPLRDESWE